MAFHLFRYVHPSSQSVLDAFSPQRESLTNWSLLTLTPRPPLPPPPAGHHTYTYPHPPQTYTTANLLYVSKAWPILDISYMWNHILHGFCDWFPLLGWHSVFKVHPCCNTYQYIFPFHGQIIFHYIDLLHFVYPLFCWWTFGLFPPFG